MSGSAGELRKCRTLITRSFMILLVCVCCLSPLGARAQGKKPSSPKPLVPDRRWRELFLGKPNQRKSVTSLEKFPLIGLEKLEFVGPKPGNEYQLGKFKIDGQWGLQGGLVQRTAGKNAAMILAEAEDFELEGVIDAEGVGGWFWLLGWKDGKGHGLYNITFRQSGSPWFFTQFDDGDAIEDAQELHKYRWEGPQPFWMSVKKQKLNLTIGPEKTAFIRDLPLPDYQPGQIILGSYDTKYGPKDVKIYSLRIRKPPKKR